MNHWGKIIGAFVGYLLTGLFGAGVGFLLGFLVDRFVIKHRPPRFTKIGAENLSRIRSEFFTASFSVMGYVSQASGRSDDAGENYANRVIERMGLPEDSRQMALELFSEGKSENFSLHKVVSQFYLDCRDQPSLLEMFLEIQLYAAVSDGNLTDSEKDIIQNIAYQLDFSAMEFDRIENLIRAECRQAETNSRRKRVAAEHWNQQLQQDQIKQQEYLRKQQVLQRKAQQKAQLEQERALRRARKAQQRQLQKEQEARMWEQERAEKRRRAQERARQRQRAEERERERERERQREAAAGWMPKLSSQLEDAYAILNMPRTASNEDIKKAYRRLTSKHHPDKLIAKGLPKEMMKIAEVKTREIRAAYDHIKEARNF